jgi:prevent-host-death family protein
VHTYNHGQTSDLRLHYLTCNHILVFPMSVSVRDLKTHLSEYLRRVQLGEAVEVTSHGKVIARLVPPSAPQESVIGRLSRMPWVRMGHAGAKLGLDEPIALHGMGPSLTDILLADRE